MSTTKFASLHSGLLARKGQAAPAIPSPRSYVAYTDNPPPDHSGDIEAKPRIRPVTAEPVARKVLPRPTMAPKPLQTMKLDTSRLEQEIELAFPHSDRPVQRPPPQTGCACKPERNAGPNRGGKGAKYQVRLRVNAEQRRRLRTAAAQFGISNQHLLSDALDTYLDNLGHSDLKNCACMARQKGAM